MNDLRGLEIDLLPGARALLAVHARELPQRDDLCGAFCGTLALRAAGIAEHDAEPLDQDAVAVAAGSVVSALARPRARCRYGEPGGATTALSLPRDRGPGRVGDDGRRAGERDRRLSSEGALAAIPYQRAVDGRHARRPVRRSPRRSSVRSR